MLNLLLPFLSLSFFGTVWTIPLHGHSNLNPSTWPSSKLNRITLIHTNDIHAHMLPFNDMGNDCSEKDIATNQCFGGAARIMSLVKQVRATRKEVYLLDGGDQFQGTMFYRHYKGNVTHRFMNELDYDAVTIGNHEFDDGPSHAAHHFQRLNFPVVCSNINTSSVPELQHIVKPFTILRGDLGIVGFITNTTDQISNSGTITFTDPAIGVQAAVDELRKQGIRRIVAVSHNGYFEDMDVAARTRGIDIIVGGHSHTLLSKNLVEPGVKGYYPTKVKNLDGNTTYIVQAKAWGKYVGVIDLLYNPHDDLIYADGDPVLLDHKIPEDHVMSRRVHEWAKGFRAFTETVIGKASSSFGMECSTGECAIANLVTDAAHYALPKLQAVLQHSGGVRASFSPGNITTAEVLGILPFSDKLVQATFTGKQIRDAYENGFAMKTRKGSPVLSILHASGIIVEADAGKPAYQRIVRLELCEDSDCQRTTPIQNDTKYQIGLSDFLCRGGDSLFESKASEVKVLDNLEKYVIDYIKLKQQISPVMDGRLKLRK